MAKNKDKKVKANKQSNKLDQKKDKKSKAKKDKTPSTPKVTKVTNVFTSIGLEPKHRAVPFQLVRHYDEVTVARNRQQFPYIAEIQLKSVFCAVVVNKGKASCWSRTGNLFQHLDVLCKSFKVKQDGVYLCELYVPESVITVEKFATLFSPFRKNKLTAPQQAILDDKAVLVVNDLISIKEFTTGKCETPHAKRQKSISKAFKKLLKGKKSRFAVPATKTCENEKELRDFAMTCIDQGNKGINVRGSDNPYVCGHNNFHYMQIVEGVTHNLTCVGFEEKDDKVANLLFTYKDKTEVKAPLSSKYSDKDSAKMLKVLLTDSKGKKKKAKKGKKVKTSGSPLGFVWEVTALEENTKGVMKLPTVGSFTKSKAEF